MIFSSSCFQALHIINNLINDLGDRVPQPDLCLVTVLQRQVVFHCGPNSSVFITGRMKLLAVPDKNDSQ